MVKRSPGGFFEELGSVIGQAVRHQFEDVVKETMVLQPMREAILAWSLFHGKADGIQQTEKIWTGQCIEVLMLKKDIQEKNVLWIKEIWDRYCICEETDRIHDIILWIKSEKYRRNLPEDHGKKDWMQHQVNHLGN